MLFCVGMKIPPSTLRESARVAFHAAFFGHERTFAVRAGKPFNAYSLPHALKGFLQPLVYGKERRGYIPVLEIALIELLDHFAVRHIVPQRLRNKPSYALDPRS